MDDELGSILREARIARGLSIDQVQEETRINPKYIAALEEGNYELLPTPVHVRGYLRNYANLLDLDSQPLIDQFEASQAAYRGGRRRRKADGDTIPPREDNPFFNPVNMQINPDQARPTSDSILRVVIIVALLASIGLVASRFFLDDGRSFDARDMFNTFISREPEPSVDDLDVETIVEEAQQIETDNPLISTSRNQLDDSEVPTPVPSIPELTDLEIINLRLDITERTWLQVYVDGELAFEGQAENSDSPLEFTANTALQLKTGNAYGLFATVNEQELGKLGERAQVYEVEWTTSQ